MKFILILSLSCFVFYGNCKIVQVKTTADLTSALSSVAPGDTINMADGLYKGSVFTGTTSGKSGSPITLTGSRKAVLTGTQYGFWLKADWWVLKGFTVANSPKGVMLEGANHNVLDGLEVYNTQQEGVHFRTSSADNTIQNSYIHDTGKGSVTDQGFGEGLYIGNAFHNWAGGKQDKSDRNQVLNNKIGPGVTAECIDIKEGSCCGVIKGNTFDGSGLSGQNSADSWIDVKGDSYDIEGNTGSHSLKDGFQIHHIDEANMGGCNNIIKNNKCSGLGAGGVCAVSASTACTNTVQ